VLILDEPTAGLDPIQQRETRNLIRELGSSTPSCIRRTFQRVEQTCQSVSSSIVAGGPHRASWPSCVVSMKPRRVFSASPNADEPAKVLR